MLNFIKSVPGIISLIGIIILVIIPSFSGPDMAPVNQYAEAMPIVISVIVLLSSLYIILSNKYPADTLKWAFGIVGLIVGYWLPT